MRVVFLGTPEFALPSLRALLDNEYEVCAVFTQPDRPSGRGQKPQPSPVKLYAQDKGIRVFQPEKIRKEENHPIFEELLPDVIVVVAYGQILPGWLLLSPRLASINVHGSLLPRYRGAAPIPWAILNGDSITGITTMLIDEKLDAGPILLQRKVLIPLTITAGELSADLSAVGADLLVQTLEDLKKGTIHPILQEESLVSWAPRISKEMAQISWQKSALEIHNQIRAMNPWPVAYTFFRNERLQIWRSLPESQVCDTRHLPGTFLGMTQSGIRVQCGGGTVLDVLEVQRAAKSRVTGREFASGARLRDGDLIFSRRQSP